ncbi:MAG: hypothetical protein CSA22_06730 [Deltaproteobacteria bacterium]|nr:MAG: hypothetical protein CSA22_06730 [Deltaproteobacteria bacterium]
MAANTTKKRRSASFDTVVKTFIKEHDIPTKHDVERLMERVEALESIMQQMLNVMSKNQGVSEKMPAGMMRKNKTASASVVDIIAEYKDGTNFATLQDRTGFGDKKLRNIIFRLDKIGKIKRRSRGVYVLA